MNDLNLSSVEKSILEAVKINHLTSFEILEKVDNVDMILSLYTILDELEIKGALKSYVKENKKFHYAA